MRFDPQLYEELLAQVEKPGRYLGNELGAVSKDPGAVALRFALAFPEVYEISQSHPGLQILYGLLNSRADTYAERAYAPWPDLEALLRRHEQPLVSLETFTPLSEFQILGFSLQYELTYTNLLAMLDLGGIPMLAAKRGARDPLVLAGGPCAFNPEPLADFLDAVLLGDGEEAIHDICDTYLAWDGRDRDELLEAVSRVDGVYVPSFYRPEYSASGRLMRVLPARPGVPATVEKRVLRDLNDVPTQETYVVPTVRVVHNRPTLEVMRGCVKGCRFCQAGYIYRPLRERDPARVLEQAERAIEATGTDEVSLLSLSTGDYSCVNPVLTELMNRHAEQRVAVSLPSTRVDALAPSLLEQIKRVRKTGFTLAPEAGSQRMRDIIQKEYQEDELLDAARQIFDLGWRSLKLYFMIGLPGETAEDVVAIADLSARVLATANRGREVTASVSTFVPKPHTPFQWAAQIDVDEIETRQSLLRRELGRRRVRFKWHDARTSYLEGVFSRGDRRVAAALLAAYHAGCRFDGWTEHCRYDLWEKAFEQTGIDPRDYLRRRYLDETLPWDHLSSGVTKKFLQHELALAVEGRLTPDCSIERCTYCGACDFEKVRNVTFHVKGAKGGEHRGERIDHWAQGITDTDGTEGGWEPRGWHKAQERARHSSPESTPASRGGASWSDSAADVPVLPAKPLEAVPRGLGNAEEWLSASSEGIGPATAPTARRPAMRVRLNYEKLRRARFIGHLELIEVFIRACRRARLPLAFSAGHRPQPRLRFSPGLPLGTESDCEVLDIDLAETVSADTVRRSLNEQLPDGLRMLVAEAVSLQTRSPEHDLIGFRYRVRVDRLSNHVAAASVDDCLTRYWGSSTFPVHRRSPKGDRETDARPLVARLERADAGHLELDLMISPGGSVKPTDFLGALLGLDAVTARALPIRKIHAFYRQDPAGDESAVTVAV